MTMISLAAARVNANYTQAQVAMAINVSKSTIVSWEKGNTSPKATQLKQLSRLYGIPEQYISLPVSLPIVE